MTLYPLVDKKPKSCEDCPFYGETFTGTDKKTENKYSVYEIVPQCQLTFFMDMIFESCPLIEIGDSGVQYV